MWTEKNRGEGEGEGGEGGRKNAQVALRQPRIIKTEFHPLQVPSESVNPLALPQDTLSVHLPPSRSLDGAPNARFSLSLSTLLVHIGGKDDTIAHLHPDQTSTKQRELRKGSLTVSAPVTFHRAGEGLGDGQGEVKLPCERFGDGVEGRWTQPKNKERVLVSVERPRKDDRVGQRKGECERKRTRET